MGSPFIPGPLHKCCAPPALSPVRSPPPPVHGTHTRACAEQERSRSRRDRSRMGPTKRRCEEPATKPGRKLMSSTHEGGVRGRKTDVWDREADEAARKPAMRPTPSFPRGEVWGKGTDEAARRRWNMGKGGRRGPPSTASLPHTSPPGARVKVKHGAKWPTRPASWWPRPSPLMAKEANEAADGKRGLPLRRPRVGLVRLP